MDDSWVEKKVDSRVGIMVEWLALQWAETMVEMMVELSVVSLVELLVLMMVDLLVEMMVVRRVD